VGIEPFGVCIAAIFNFVKFFTSSQRLKSVFKEDKDDFLFHKNRGSDELTILRKA
jgi:hypothetical protein